MEIINEEFKNQLTKWKESGKRRPYFSKYYLNKLQCNPRYMRLKDARIKNEENNKYIYKYCLEDGFTMEETIKLYYKIKVEKIRLANKLKELNINPWEVQKTNADIKLSSRNKPGNLTKAFYKGNEIIF